MGASTLSSWLSRAAPASMPQTTIREHVSGPTLRPCVGVLESRVCELRYSPGLLAGLHLAASEGNLPIVEYLITTGEANINVVDRWGGTVVIGSTPLPCLFCSVLPHCPYIRHTLSWCCLCCRAGTPLADAIRHGHAMVAKSLITHGARLEWDEVRASSELCEIARQGDVHRMEMLLLAGCNVDSADYDRCVTGFDPGASMMLPLLTCCS